METKVPSRSSSDEPVVVTGIGMITSTGRDRESVWRAVRQGKSGVRRLRGLRGIPDDELLGAPVDLEVSPPGRLKVIPLTELAAEEALRDARVNFQQIDRERFGCLIAGHMGDSSWVDEQLGLRHAADP